MRALKKWYRKSLEIKERLGNESGAAITYAQIGVMLRDQKRYTTSGQSFLEAIKRMMRIDDREMTIRMTIDFFRSFDEASPGEKSELKKIWDQYALGDFNKVRQAIFKPNDKES